VGPFQVSVALFDQATVVSASGAGADLGEEDITGPGEREVVFGQGGVCTVFEHGADPGEGHRSYSLTVCGCAGDRVRHAVPQVGSRRRAEYRCEAGWPGRRRQACRSYGCGPSTFWKSERGPVVGCNRKLRSHQRSSTNCRRFQEQLACLQGTETGRIEWHRESD
jgi:hypothetical protein